MVEYTDTGLVSKTPFKWGPHLLNNQLVIVNKRSRAFHLPYLKHVNRPGDCPFIPLPTTKSTCRPSWPKLTFEASNKHSIQFIQCNKTLTWDRYIQYWANKRSHSIKLIQCNKTLTWDRYIQYWANKCDFIEVYYYCIIIITLFYSTYYRCA